MIRLNLIFSMSLAALSFSAYALEADRQQAVSIQSDSAEVDELTGQSLLSGNVVIKQGSIIITANEVIAKRDGEELVSIHSTGKPAQYQQRLQAGGDILTAQASTIEYDFEKNVIRLRKQASITQGDSTISGEEINFDLVNESMQAKGDNSGKTRVEMVIQPKKNPPTEDTQAQPNAAESTEESQ